MCSGVLGRTVLDRVINGPWLSIISLKVVSYCCDRPALLFHGLVEKHMLINDLYKTPIPHGHSVGVISDVFRCIPHGSCI